VSLDELALFVEPDI